MAVMSDEREDRVLTTSDIEVQPLYGPEDLAGWDPDQQLGRPGDFPFTRGVLLTHLLVHAIHHRAQCLNMLRHLNVPGVSDAIPDLDLNEWQFETEVKP